MTAHSVPACDTAIHCKNNEILPQAGNDETTKIREDTCEVNWDGLQSRNTVWKYYRQHGRSKITHKEQSTIKHTSGKYCAGAAPSSTYGLPPMISIWGLLCVRPKSWPWVWYFIDIRQRCQEKEQKWSKKKKSGRICGLVGCRIRRSSSRWGRELFSGGWGSWGVFRIRWGGSSNECGTLSVGWGVWGNWGD